MIMEVEADSIAGAEISAVTTAGGLTQHTGVLFKGKRMSNFSQKIIDEPPPNVLKIDVMKTFLSWNYSYLPDNSTKYCFYHVDF